MMTTHEFYIQRCFQLAKQALGQTSPNPYVGSVIVKEGRILGEGFHAKSGGPHAEIVALENTSEDVSGATLYCNLEPCCHTHKKTPPCAQRLTTLGLKQVVIANLDPNPEVAGRGVEILKEAGIDVITGVLEKEGALLNEVFFTHITKKRPFIHLKWAQTLDGKIATLDNHSKWITGEAARINAHKERALYDAILVGGATANHDNPSLTIRLGEEICKTRIILSPSLNLKKELKVLNDEFKHKTMVITASKDQMPGIKTLYCPLDENGFNLDYLMQVLYAQGLYSLYVEGGMHTISKFIDANLHDRFSIYMAPKLLGPGVSLQTHSKIHMHDALTFEDGLFRTIHNDIIFESRRNICLQD